MELCEKNSLAEILENGKSLSETEAIYIIKELIKAYRSLYQQKILHRDIKPANILISKENKVKLADFGLSVHVKDLNPQQREMIGTTSFMSP
jgi:serine/threonine protein kinase